MIIPEKFTLGVQMNRRNENLPAICFDCDDVLLDWQNGFRDWLWKSKGVHLSKSGPTTWDMDKWVGQPARPLIEQFNGSADFGYLLPCLGAREAVAKFYARGHQLHVVTACATDSVIVERRTKNLDALFGDVFTSIVCVPLGFAKSEALETIRRSSSQRPVWIEDNYKNCLLGVELGFDCWMFRRNHNRSHEDFVRPDVTWTDTFDPILEAHLGKGAV
jgi:FMN phosphatase YigB (HAD superfamily)